MSENKDIKKTIEAEEASVVRKVNPFDWYVLRVSTGYEQRVSAAVAALVEREDLQAFVGEVLIPIENVLEMRGGQKRKSQRKFFPGYVLIEVKMDDEVCHKLRSLTHVLGFVGGSRGRPVPVPQKEIDGIFERVEQSEHKVTPKVLFEPGEIVRVIDGPFDGFQGVVEDVNYEKSRLRVGVLIFGRSTPVEIEFSQVERET
jgi:transcription termination/antitermination protein NusG